jgi:hypothetical protein
MSLAIVMSGKLTVEPAMPTMSRKPVNSDNILFIEYSLLWKGTEQ